MNKNDKQAIYAAIILGLAFAFMAGPLGHTPQVSAEWYDAYNENVYAQYSWAVSEDWEADDSEVISQENYDVEYVIYIWGWNYYGSSHTVDVIDDDFWKCRTVGYFRFLGPYGVPLDDAMTFKLFGNGDWTYVHK